MSDNYLNRLREASWNWMEKRTWWKRGVKRSKKDRVSGRNDKRGARAEDRKAILKEIE